MGLIKGKTTWRMKYEGSGNYELGYKDKVHKGREFSQFQQIVVPYNSGDTILNWIIQLLFSPQPSKYHSMSRL